jgi:hypothetical protein
MYQHENLWIKISDDFHAEINPILEELNPDAINHYWFKKRSIQGKFFIVDNVLLSLNGTGTNQYLLTKLKHTLEAYKTRIKSYFDTHNIATCFVFFSTESFTAISNYFDRFSDYRLSYSKEISIGYIFKIGIDIIGFPNDCSFKLSAKISKKNEVTITRHNDPLFDIEKEKGKEFGSTERTRQQQEEIENYLNKKQPGLSEKGEKNAMQEFTLFAEKTYSNIISLINNFDRCINLCNNLIDKQQKDTTPANLPEIEKIYFVLKNGYIQEPLEKFTAIFQPEYSGQKIVWLKSGPELKYFVDRMNDKLNLTNRINKWTDSRFELKNQPEHLPKYLTRQKTEGTIYQLLLSGNDRKNPLYKLFREL